MHKGRLSYEKYSALTTKFPNLHMHRECKRVLQRLYNKEMLPSHFSPVPYIFDYTQNKFLFIDEMCYNLYGYTAQKWMEEGVERYFQKWHPSDYQVMNQNIFPENMRFLQSVSLDHYADLIFSFNYRTLTAKGKYITVLQRSSYIPSTIIGKPLGSIGVTIDISHFKTDSSVIHTIEESKQKNGQINYKLLYKRTYAIEDTTPADVSSRELEVLKMMAEGYSSKQIAKNLCLSINTVNNHRKNMLHKTGCKSSTALLNYAMRQGYL